jgi:23S rRNA A1618 N6-methylase RlmF
MRAPAIIFFAATMCCSPYHASADELIQLAQATPNVVTPTPGHPTANQACTATCGSTQLACQSSCALLAPSP